MKCRSNNLINKIRNMYGYTGYYKGHRVTVMSSRMGMPSMGIYALELFKYYEVEKIIRIGTCGALREDEELMDIVIGDSYYTNSNFADSLCDENVHMVYPNKDEVYYTDVVYVINEFWGDLKPDGESTELRFFDLENLPENIMPTQIGYIKKFVEEENKA